jgi:hypothetical protein
MRLANAYTWILNLNAPCNLSRKQERLRKSAFTTELERPEIPIPRSFRDDRLRFDPETQSIQVFQSDLAVVHSLHKMVANTCGKAGPAFDLRHDPPGSSR